MTQSNSGPRQQTAADPRRSTLICKSSQKAFVETKLKAAELRSASEYIRFLIQKEQLKDLRDEIDKLLLEAQTSGPGTPMTLQEWKDIEQEGLALLAQERKDARKGHQKRRW